MKKVLVFTLLFVLFSMTLAPAAQAGFKYTTEVHKISPGKNIVTLRITQGYYKDKMFQVYLQQPQKLQSEAIAVLIVDAQGQFDGHLDKLYVTYQSGKTMSYDISTVRVVS